MAEERLSTPDPKTSLLVSRIFPITGAGNLYDAFCRVDRADFLPLNQRGQAYMDLVVRVSEKSTNSQPSLTAKMLKELRLQSTQRVLEIGTGSGYVAALTGSLCHQVDTIEVDPVLADQARERLDKLGFRNVQVFTGDGILGLPERAPYDRIIVTAHMREVPQMLIDQLAEYGLIVTPANKDFFVQKLILGIKHDGNLFTKVIAEKIGFVPLMSEHPGGWTDELIENTALVKLYWMHQSLGLPKEIPEEEVIKLFKEKNKLPPDLPDHDILSTFELPDSAFDQALIKEAVQEPKEEKTTPVQPN